ncbi:MAG: ubiquitin-like small modifier protein 1 [Dehalococcoidia bacterium]
MLRVRLYATLRQYVNDAREVTLDLPAMKPVSEVLELLFASHQDLRSAVLDEEGQLRPYVNVFVNGRSIRDIDGMQTVVAPGAEFAIFPPVAGGAGGPSLLG